MNWKASLPGIETAAISFAALCLGGAVGFAVMQIAPLGAGVVEASVAGLLATLAGWVLMGQVDRRRGSRFLAISPLIGGNMGGDVLLLDQFVRDEVLLLDDPLPVLRDDMRVVRLFARVPIEADAATPLTVPGEMIARIENFLDQPRLGATPVEPARGTGRAAAADANAALHVALADIRRSLRQA